MGKIYRSLLLKYDLLELPPDVAEKVSDLIEVQEQFRRWIAEWMKGGPLPEKNPLRYFANEAIHAGKMLSWFKGLRKNGVKRMRPPLIFNAQLRLEKERDTGRGVFVDLPKREVRIRRWSSQWGNIIVLLLSESAVKWITERAREGGRLVLAAVWVGQSRKNRAVKLYVALVFRREVGEVAPLQVRRLLVVDFNALHNGLSWAVVEGDKIVAKGVMRPDISKILRLQKIATRLDSICVQRNECDEATATKSKIWRLLRSWEDEAVKKLVRLALQYRATIVVDVPKDRSISTLKEGSYNTQRKIFLNFGRLRRRLRGMAEWYGIPYREQRLYSTLCPRCRRKMSVLPDRRVKCTCGFEAHRDEVPLHWAMRLFPKLISFSSSPFSWEARGGRRYGPVPRGACRGSQPADGGGFCADT
jgi:putative transposase